MRPTIDVEVACGTAEKQLLRRLSVEQGSTARIAAVFALGDEQPEGIDVRRCALGIWGKPVSDDYQLQQGDRLELYRPLKIDPREARRELARRGLSMGAGAVDRHPKPR